MKNEIYMFKNIAVCAFFVCFSLNAKAFDLGAVGLFARQSTDFFKDTVVPLAKPIVVSGVVSSVIVLGYDSVKAVAVTSLFWLIGEHKRICAQQKKIVEAQIEEEKKQILHQKCKMMAINARINNLSAWILNENPEYADTIRAMVQDLGNFVDLLEKQ